MTKKMGVDWDSWETTARTWWQDPKSPLWPILHTVVATACFTVAMVVTASSFDATELKAIGGGAGASGLLIYLIKRISGGGAAA